MLHGGKAKEMKGSVYLDCELLASLPVDPDMYASTSAPPDFPADVIVLLNPPSASENAQRT